MRTFFDEMAAAQAKAEQDRAAKREAEQATKAGVFETKTTPMEERLRRIIRAMPDSEKDKPRHIRWFCEQLKSKYSGGRKRAALHEVGPALAAIGWERRRLWLGPDVTFRVWWFPPGAPKACEVKEALQRARQESSPPKQRRKRVDWTPGCPLSPDQIAA